MSAEALTRLEGILYKVLEDGGVHSKKELGDAIGYLEEDLPSLWEHIANMRLKLEPYHYSIQHIQVSKGKRQPGYRLVRLLGSNDDT